MVTIKKDEDTGSVPHKLYEILQFGGFPANGGPVQGNFEKFIISRDGKKMYRFCNSDLLDWRSTLEIEKPTLIKL